jgi:MOSC domain-containing protein YiiM
VATVSGLFVSPGRKSGVSTPLARARALAGHGLEGCAHGGRPHRQVLFASRDHLDALGVNPGAIRENITVSGADVQAWPVGQRVRAGTALFEITMECEPCERMNELREGLRAALVGRRGMLARVLEDGDVAVGDRVELVA